VTVSKNVELLGGDNGLKVSCVEDNGSGDLGCRTREEVGDDARQGGVVRFGG